MTASRSRDAILAGGTLAVFVGLFLLVDVELSVGFLLAGGAGTIAFEAVTMPRAQLVRRYWARPAVQAGSVLLAVGIAVGGALVVPSIVLSAGIGSLVTYLVFLGFLEPKLRTE